MLIVLAGLPGTGKTTVARLLARRLAALHLRIDTIEQAMRNEGMADEVMGAAGYAVAQVLAADNLRLGRTIIADAVNPVREAREAWREIASSIDVPIVEVELICSEVDVHRRRVETRAADIAGHAVPDWHAVQRRHYEPWDSEHWVIDTAAVKPAQVVAQIANAVAHIQANIADA